MSDDLRALDKSLAEAMGWTQIYERLYGMGFTIIRGCSPGDLYPTEVPHFSREPVAAKELMEYLRTEGYYHEIRWHPGDGLYTAVVCLAPAYGRDEAGSWTVALVRAALAAIQARNEATRRTSASER